MTTYTTHSTNSANGRYVDNSYYIDEDRLIIDTGKTGNIIDEDALTNAIQNAIRDKLRGTDVTELDIPVVTKTPPDIDLAQIRNDIHRDVQDAAYDTATGKLTVQANGIDFDIEQAKELLTEDKDQYTIPLTITKPDVTTDMLGADAFPDVLGEFTTRFSLGDDNRNTNMALAAEAIDGTVLLPGEVFSFNSVVGNTTAAKGYKLAGAYAAGELVQNYGGGICQVSSTLYNTAVYANLEIVQRYNHSSIVSYLEPGRDATISYGTRDLKFKNSRDYAIKINAKAKNGVVEIEIRGIKQDNEYEIEIVSEQTELIVCDKSYKYDSSLEPGQEVIETTGANGAKSKTYKITKQNGKIISQDLLSEDTYNPMKQIIRTGTKQ